MKYAGLFLISLLLFGNCNTMNAVNSNDTETVVQSKPKGTYLVTSLYGVDVSKHKLTLIFNPTKKTISGFAGCNSYSCEYNIEENSLTTGFPIGTKIYCEETSNIEKDFFKIFSEEKNQKLEGNILYLTNQNNQKILIAEKTS
ncbi:Heat shock protein HslJ [Aquimarina amphilecti]|uniref:Heat shock protein HslJ n=1 Tax=Aquimarina amphilecti TaxID=1038014 RepID=A0A1H7S9H1_AQUAM|nr:META domain-containing protein [Aquimarina amphilecti]SEL69038.1 Heat shock protein HslJ [Aquimarina amphilecti]